MKMSHQSYPSADKFVTPLLLLAILFAFLPLALAGAAAYGAQLDPEQALLRGPAPGRCAGATAGADYVGGTDATGHPVIPAEGPDAAPALQIPNQTVLVHRQGVTVPVEIRGLNRALSAGNGCPALTGDAPRP